MIRQNTFYNKRTPACMQGLEELALACFCEGKLVGDKLPSSAPECALSYAAIGGIFFHLEQYQVALNFFDRVRDSVVCVCVCVCVCRERERERERETKREGERALYVREKPSTYPTPYTTPASTQCR